MHIHLFSYESRECHITSTYHEKLSACKSVSWTNPEKFLYVKTREKRHNSTMTRNIFRVALRTENFLVSLKEKSVTYITYHLNNLLKEDLSLGIFISYIKGKKDYCLFIARHDKPYLPYHFLHMTFTMIYRTDCARGCIHNGC